MKDLVRNNIEFLEFERPIAELEAKIEALTKSSKRSADVQIKINQLRSKVVDLMKKIYGSLSDWQIIQIARHPERPHFLDLHHRVFDNFQELRGDRAFADDRAIIGGLAELGDRTVMIIGQEKGRKTKDKLYHNFGMVHPEGYRKALRLMKLAEKFDIPIITFIDTPGAYPGIKAEERGQSEAIASNLFEMSRIHVPIICLIIGEGCSGGALGIGVGDSLMMLQYSYFATISPEGCASILWKTAAKASDAAEIMGITANHLKKHGIIDEIISEPIGGGHRNVGELAAEIKFILQHYLNELCSLSNEERLAARYKRLMSFGAFEEERKIKK